MPQRATELQSAAIPIPLTHRWLAFKSVSLLIPVFVSTVRTTFAPKLTINWSLVLGARLELTTPASSAQRSTIGATRAFCLFILTSYWRGCPELTNSLQLPVYTFGDDDGTRTRIQLSLRRDSPVPNQLGYATIKSVYFASLFFLRGVFHKPHITKSCLVPVVV